MNSEVHNSKSRSSLISLQDQYFNSIKDVRRGENGNNVEVKKMEYYRRCSLISQGQGHMNMNMNMNGKSRRMFRYFTLESLLLLVCITVSLLVLPVVLPPLPPPPLLLLLLPILILALLMLLAFMPADKSPAFMPRID